MSVSSFNSTFSFSSSSYPEFEIAEPMATRPPMHERKASPEHNAAMREIIKSWGSISASPPGCQYVAYSSWRRFSSSEASTKSSEDLKASVLWTPMGTTPDFNPPLHERTYLGVNQPKPVKCGKPQREQRDRRERHPYRRKPSTLRSSWSTDSSDADGEKCNVNAILFKKQPVKSISTNSLLSEGIKLQSRSASQESTNSIQMFPKTLGKEKLSASMLPSAFDSDSEDEDCEK